MKMPALQFYPADWRKDPGVQALGFFDRGVWFEMLCLMHESNERGVLMLNGAPMPESALASALGLDKQKLSKTLTTLLTYGVARRREEDGAIYSKRMVKDEKLCQIRREAGKKGGNPTLLNQTSNSEDNQNTTTRDNQTATPSSSSSSSEKNTRARPEPVDNSINGTTQTEVNGRAKEREKSKPSNGSGWMRSEKGTVDKGKALGMEAGPGESWEAYRERIVRRIETEHRGHS